MSQCPTPPPCPLLSLPRLCQSVPVEDQPSGKLLQQLRGLEVLEWTGTAPAIKVVERLAQGPDAARLTREARSVLKRMATHSKTGSS